MDLDHRIGLLVELGEYMQSGDEEWAAVKTKAFQHNAWFIPDFIDQAVHQIATRFLKPDLLRTWAERYHIPQNRLKPKSVGVVMAGNIPLVGFHDFLCCFLSGHRQIIKPSSKDRYLLPALTNFLSHRIPAAAGFFQTADMLKGLDAYIATGSNNSARYFDYYFAKYPSLIRRNRTSVAILEGNETEEELGRLADDVFFYFGLGCRNVTQIHVPAGYDFVPLLTAFRKYSWMADHNKYKNNYDYRLSLAILNKEFYMTNENVLLIESPSAFSPIAVLHYTYYTDRPRVLMPQELENLQCIVGRNHVPFGESQKPGLSDYADGADTMQFLVSL